ncbi:MAG: hypothetical protein RJA09_421, partial [Pseudomonadota bacterium]
MSAHLQDHTEWIGQLAPGPRGLLEQNWSDA